MNILRCDNKIFGMLFYILLFIITLLVFLYICYIQCFHLRVVFFSYKACMKENVLLYHRDVYMKFQAT